MKEIAKVINCLVNYPHLLTSEIVQAGIEEGDAGLLDFLPSEYLTQENVRKFICAADKARYGSSFNLSRIPLAMRTYEFCKFAVEAHVSNYFYVPMEHRDRTFLESVIHANPDSMKYYAQTPASAWTKELAYNGLNAVIRKVKNRYSSYNTRNHYSYTPPTNLYLTQAFLSYVPSNLKDGCFYRDMFNKTDLKAEEVVFLTPNKYKQDAFYLTLAGVDFKLVPKSKYSYQHFKIALNNTKKISDLTDDEELMKQIEVCMDDTLADLILTGNPSYFPKLPKKFQTSRRLISAIERGGIYFLSDVDKSLFTLSVCKAMIKKQDNIPELPEKVWTADFVKFCMENGCFCYWLRTMPPHLMTQELADKIILKGMLYYLDRIPAKFITPEHAITINRRGDERDREYIPPLYFREFTNETGLSKEFMGGEVSFATLREHADNFIYCRLGQTYLGFYWNDTGNNLIMTRRTSASIYPQQIFERRINTFHTTWVEKTVADNDQRFVKPSVPKKLKELSFSPYCGLEHLGTHLGVDYYANTFLGAGFLYCAMVRDMPVFRKTEALILEAIKDHLDE